MADEWVLVPREPTEAMEDAGVNQMRKTREAGGGFGYSLMAAWRAMLAAAPPPPVREEMEGDMREAVARIVDPNGWPSWGAQTSGPERLRTLALAKADIIIAQIVEAQGSGVETACSLQPPAPVALASSADPQPASWKPEREAVIKALNVMTEPGVRSVGDIADAILALPSAPIPDDETLAQTLYEAMVPPGSGPASLARWASWDEIKEAGAGGERYRIGVRALKTALLGERGS